MRLFELFPPTAFPPDLMRNVNTLSAREWNDLLEALMELEIATANAHERATEEWARRYPREDYATAGEWYEAIDFEPPEGFFEREGEGSERAASS